MRNLLLVFIFFVFSSCSNTKGVYWCGDHACVNKKERMLYFKKNLIVEKRDIKKENKLTKSEIDIIEKKIKDEENSKNLNDKKAKKISKEREKALIKEEKRRLKEAKLYEKRRLKEEKKRLKNMEKEKKKRIKEEEKKSKKDKKSSNVKKTILLTDNNNFNKIKDSIINKNAGKKYPDINDVQR